MSLIAVGKEEFEGVQEIVGLKNCLPVPSPKLIGIEYHKILLKSSLYEYIKTFVTY